MHHNNFYDSVKTACLEKLGSQVNAKMLLANQIWGFSKFNISKTIGGINMILLGPIILCLYSGGPFSCNLFCMYLISSVCFPNKSGRLCLIILKIDMLYQIGNTFWDTVF